MYGVLQRVEQQSGDDIQKRHLLSFDSKFSQEKETALAQLFEYWRAFSRGGIVDDEKLFRPSDILPPEVSRWVSWVDTSAPSPLDFIWRDHVYAWEGNTSNLFYDTSGIRVRDYGFERHGRFCATEYHMCKQLKQPLYHEIEQWKGSVHRHYVRLLLPVQNARGDVNRLVYVCRRI